MSIKKWFIEKITQLKKVLRTKQTEKIDAEFRLWLEEWRVVHDSVIEDDEMMERQKQEYLAEYEKQCREEDERQAQREKELMAQVLEDKHTEQIIADEEQILQAIRDDIIWKREQCPSCGYSSWECTCYLDEEDDKPEIPQMGLPGHEEEEIPLWLEHANEKCPNCGLLPEFCQCQYEE